MDIELNRLQAKTAALILESNSNTCSKITLETVTSSALRGALVIEVEWSSSRESRTFIIDRNGTDAELKNNTDAFA